MEGEGGVVVPVFYDHGGCGGGGGGCAGGEVEGWGGHFWGFDGWFGVWILVWFGSVFDREGCWRGEVLGWWGICVYIITITGTLRFTSIHGRMTEEEGTTSRREMELVHVKFT